MTDIEALKWIEDQAENFRITKVDSIELGKGYTVTGKETVGFGKTLKDAIKAAQQNYVTYKG